MHPYDLEVVAETLAAATLICLDPGHATLPAIGAEQEPIGPGSRITKIKDPGGAPGEAAVVLAIATKTRFLLLRQGYRVAMTRTGATFRGGNIERARFCNRRRAALMLRIHADGSSDASQSGVSTLTPALRRGWTDDVYADSRRAARIVQRALVSATGARDLGVVERSDLTGFNWANVPVVLAEAGFLSNRRERRLLHSSTYQWRVARGLATAVSRFTRPAGARSSVRPWSGLRHGRRGAASPDPRAPPRPYPPASPRPRTPPAPRPPAGNPRAAGATPLRGDPPAPARPTPAAGV
ncbi:MAG TPA: N-acetylmuramoyl-L-alanine amidase [Gaiellaceae bacterium]|nr:N-acetylmuramoyl-L-alanine amidase [Gaiellaceae bacterium]